MTGTTPTQPQARPGARLLNGPADIRARIRAMPGMTQDVEDIIYEEIVDSVEEINPGGMPQSIGGILELFLRMLFGGLSGENLGLLSTGFDAYAAGVGDDATQRMVDRAMFNLNERLLQNNATRPYAHLVTGLVGGDTPVTIQATMDNSVIGALRQNLAASGASAAEETDAPDGPTPISTTQPLVAENRSSPAPA